jgi:hypothetical protein
MRRFAPRQYLKQHTGAQDIISFLVCSGYVIEVDAAK